MRQGLDRLLVPAQYSPGEEQGQHRAQQRDAHDPVGLAWKSVGTCHVHPHQVKQEHHHGQVGGPEVDPADHLSARHLGHDEPDADVRDAGVRSIELAQ